MKPALIQPSPVRGSSANFVTQSPFSGGAETRYGSYRSYGGKFLVRAKKAQQPLDIYVSETVPIRNHESLIANETFETAQSTSRKCAEAGVHNSHIPVRSRRVSYTARAIAQPEE